jgi:PAS domain S-box-containing protein
MTRKRILIVEDEKITAMEMSEHLRQHGYQPLGPCASGEEAVTSAYALHPDAVLMDIALKGPMDGIQAAEAIRSKCPCPVIYVTALSDQATLDRAKITEPAGYILKPINERELHIAIEIALHRAKLEEKLRESEERYRIVIEHSNDGIAITQEGIHVYVNHKFLEMFGYSDQEEILNKSIADAPHIHPDDLQRVAEWNRQRLRGETVPLTYEHKAIHKDGRTIYVELSSTRITHQGKVASLSYMRDITERKRAGEALKLSEEKYRSLVESSSDAIFMLDTQRTLTSCNQAFLDLFGYEKEEVKNRSIRLIHASDASFEAYGQRAYPAVQKHGTFRTEWDFARKDGTTVAVESVTFAVKGPDGAIKGFAGIIRDITERKRAGTYREMGGEVLQILNEPGDLQDSIQRVLAALKTRTGFDAVGIRLQDGDDFPYFAQKGFSKDFLLTENTLIEHAADGGVCRDKDGNVSLECTCGLVISGKTDPANPLFTRGGSCWTNDSFPLLNIPPGEDPRLHPRNQCMHQGYASVALVPFRNKDRIVGLIQLNDRRKGRFTLETVELLEGIASHIGEALMRKRAEEALRGSEEKYRSVYNNAPLGFVLWDKDCRISEWNEQAEATFGWSHDEAVGRNFFDLIIPEQGRPHVEGIVKDLMSGRIERHIIHDNIKKNGEPVWCEWNNAILRDNEGELVGVVSLALDITERKQAEEKIRAALKEKEVLLKEIHHRVKNNLQVVSSLLYLQSTRTDDPGAASALRESRNRVKSMALIHERLYQSPNLASVDMGKYTRNLVSDLRRSLGFEDSSVRLTLTIEDIPLGVTEAIPCGLIINELVSNALKHAFPTGKEGEITIQLQRGNTNQITLTVSDNGIGFPEHVDFRQSLSLGLTLINSLVEQLNGTIELDRRGGTTFTITFNVSG